METDRKYCALEGCGTRVKELVGGTGDGKAEEDGREVAGMEEEAGRRPVGIAVRGSRRGWKGVWEGGSDAVVIKVGRNGLGPAGDIAAHPLRSQGSTAMSIHHSICRVRAVIFNSKHRRSLPGPRRLSSPPRVANDHPTSTNCCPGPC